jgi:hypothetical protein
MKQLFASALLLLLAGCPATSFERNTYNTLSSSKAVLQTAQDDYMDRTIPQTHCANAIITDAKKVHDTAVSAMVAYEQIKVTKGNLAPQEQIVVNDVAALAPLIVKVSALIKDPPNTCNAAADAAAIQKLKASGVTNQ